MGRSDTLNPANLTPADVRRMEQIVKAYYSPSRSDRHVNRPLTEISIGWMQDAEGFVASSVFPNLPVMNQSNSYYVYNRGSFYRDEMRARAPGTQTVGVNYELSTDVYNAVVRGLHVDIDDQSRANEDSPLMADQDATMLLTQMAMINKERNWATDYLSTNVWTFEIDGDAARSANFDPTSATANNLQYWSEAASTPIEDIRLLKRSIQAETGMRPNTLTLAREVFDVLLDHPDIVGRLDRGQTTGPAMAKRDSLAALFELERVMVMDSIYNAASEGVDDDSSFIGGKHGLLSYRPAAPGIRTPSAGYTFSWRGYLGASEMGTRMKRFRMEPEASDRIEIESAYDFKVISADLGCFLNGIVE